MEADLPLANAFPGSRLAPMPRPRSPTHIEDAFQTMALVEALYESSNNSGRWSSLP